MDQNQRRAFLDSWRPRALAVLHIVTAYLFMAHASQGSMLVPLLNQGKLAVLYCFVFLYFISSAAGAWSVERMRR